jgi:hypothetical protein
LPTVRKKIGGKTSVDRATIREMQLWLDNTEHLYRTKEAWITNYAKKIRNGSFNRSLALKGIANNLVPMIARDYNKEFGRGSIPALTLVDKRKVAVGIVKDIIEEAREKVKHMTPLKKKKVKK